jgi:hypothetical protein
MIRNPPFPSSLLDGKIRSSISAAATSIFAGPATQLAKCCATELVANMRYAITECKHKSKLYLA